MVLTATHMLDASRMTSDTNEAVVRRFYEELWNEWRLDVVAEIVAPNIRFRGSLGSTLVGRDEFKRYVETVRAAFPPLCASYDGHDAAHEPIWAELTPWSGPAQTITIASSFEIVSGPNGGPCPTGGGEQPASPPAPGTAPPSTTPDTTPPDTQIFKSMLKRRPPIFVFHFQSTEPGSTFRCKLDSHPFIACSSPQTYKHLKPGRHMLEVAAIDAAGNQDPTPAVAQFKFPKTRKHRPNPKRGHRSG